MEHETPHSVFRRCVKALGGQSAAAQLFGKSQPTIHLRLRDNREIWAEHVLAAEAATGISRHDLRPDIYPREPLPAGAHSAAAAPSPASSSSDAGAFSPTDQEAR